MWSCHPFSFYMAPKESIFCKFPLQDQHMDKPTESSHLSAQCVVHCMVRIDWPIHSIKVPRGSWSCFTLILEYSFINLSSPHLPKPTSLMQYRFPLAMQPVADAAASASADVDARQHESALSATTDGISCSIFGSRGGHITRDAEL